MMARKLALEFRSVPYVKPMIARRGKCHDLNSLKASLQLILGVVLFTASINWFNIPASFSSAVRK